MGRLVSLLFVIAFGSFALARTRQTGGSNEGLEILKKTVAALRDVKTVSYKAEYKATGWATKFVPAVTGTATMGDQSKNKIDPFSCEVKIAPYESSEVMEFSRGPTATTISSSTRRRRSVTRTWTRPCSACRGSTSSVCCCGNFRHRAF